MGHTFRMALAATSLLMGAACTLTAGLDESSTFRSCEADSDCPQAEECGVEGFCAPRFGGVPDAASDATGTPDATSEDTGGAVDGSPDSGSPDTSAPDASSPDAVADSSAPDLEPDTGTPDTSMPDMVADAMVDTSVPDMSVVQLSTCPSPFLTMINDHHDAGPGRDSDNYTAPASGDRTNLRSSIQALVSGDVAAAEAGAASANYNLCESTEGGDRVALWTPGNGAAGGAAAWAIRLDGTPREIVVESAHAYFETNTFVEALTAFSSLGARALIVAGGHRCSSDTQTSCSGSTSVCDNNSSPYRISDVAHSTTSAFQVAHEEIAAAYPATIAISLHGFSSSGASVSDGTERTISDQSVLASFFFALEAALPGENITTCNTFPGSDTDGRTCGTTNVQGRHSNGSLNACSTAASASSDRFIHLEQSLTIRQNNIDDVISALDTALP